MIATNTLFVAGIAAFLSLSAARAAIVLSGDVLTTGGTFEITQDITITVTTTGNGKTLVFKDWVTSDDSAHAVDFTEASLNYQINGGSVQSTTLDLVADNFAFPATNDIGPNDGYIYFNDIAVTAGDILTVKSGSWATSGKAGFNPEAIQTYTGEVFLMTGNGEALSGGVVVPEPSTWAALCGAGMLGLALWRRHKAA